MDLLLSMSPFCREFRGGSELRSNVQSSEPQRIRQAGRLLRKPLPSAKSEPYPLCVDMCRQSGTIALGNREV